MANLTPKQAKEKSLAIWKYLKNHPGISSKGNLPPYIRIHYVEPYLKQCPLCDLYWFGHCKGCALEIEGGMCRDRSFFDKWLYARSEETRAAAAGRIAEIIKRWEPEDE